MKVIITVVIIEIVDSSKIELKYAKNNTVETADIAIATILLPISTTVNALSYLSNIFNNVLAVLLPSSALICILNLLQHAKAVSAPAKKKCRTNKIIITIHDILGSGINKPLPSELQFG